MSANIPVARNFRQRCETPLASDPIQLGVGWLEHWRLWFVCVIDYAVSDVSAGWTDLRI